MSDSQGKKANDHGEQNRRAIAGILLAHGFCEIGPVHVNLSHGDAITSFMKYRDMNIEKPKKAFASDMTLCNNVHGLPLKANFLIYHDQWPQPLALMTRTQNSSGSAIEKLEFLYANIMERFPCRALVLLDGEEFFPAVFRRGNEWVWRSGGKVARVFEQLTEFRCWMTDGFPYPPIPETIPGLS